MTDLAAFLTPMETPKRPSLKYLMEKSYKKKPRFNNNRFQPYNNYNPNKFEQGNKYNSKNSKNSSPNNPRGGEESTGGEANRW